MTQPVLIDEVRQNKPRVKSDRLEIEWFEHKRYKLIRKTQAGLLLELRLPERQQWCDGDQLFAQGQLMATIVVKPCLSIQFTAESKADAADFCYYVGNRHLPIFCEGEMRFLVAYDGRLFEQLTAKFTTQIQLVEARLLFSKSLRICAQKA